uniref:Uncharacterized protein n=1 Tax=Arundo donax TaxID=35708 RepID=A0A0A9BG05_ARUDO
MLMGKSNMELQVLSTVFRPK